MPNVLTKISKCLATFRANVEKRDILNANRCGYLSWYCWKIGLHFILTSGHTTVTRRSICTHMFYRDVRQCFGTARRLRRRPRGSSATRSPSPCCRWTGRTDSNRESRPWRQAVYLFCQCDDVLSRLALADLRKTESISKWSSKKEFTNDDDDDLRYKESMIHIFVSTRSSFFCFLYFIVVCWSRADLFGLFT